MKNQKKLIKAINRLAAAIEKMHPIEAMTDAGVETKVPWHDTFTEDTPLSMMRNFKLIPQTGINALHKADLITFGDLLCYEGEIKKHYCSLTAFGPTSYANLMKALETEGVVTDYFKCLR